jgi:hypothetical protein
MGPATALMRAFSASWQRLCRRCPTTNARIFIRATDGLVAFFRGRPTANQPTCSNRPTFASGNNFCSALHTANGVCASLQCLQLGNHRRIHAAILRPPFVKRRVAHPMLKLKRGHWRAAVSPSQDREDLGFAISCYFQVNLLMHLAEKFLRLRTLLWGVLQCRDQKLDCLENGSYISMKSACG